MKPKKPGYRKLWKIYKQQVENDKLNWATIATLRTENNDLRKKFQQHVDTSMIEQRVKLANALGQMMHTVTDAVKFVIAKEVM